MTVSHQILIERIIKNEMEILELKRTVNEMKNSIGELNSKSELAEERISKHEDKSIEIMQFKEQRKIRIKENEQSFREL